MNRLLEKALKLAAKTLLVEGEVSDEKAAERFEVCLKCSERDGEENRCKVCGCFLEVKTKAETNWNAKRMRNEITHCPLGKWGDAETANIYREMDGKELI